MTDIISRITDYLASGGLFNPELMHGPATRDLLIDCREEIARLREQLNKETTMNSNEGHGHVRPRSDGVRMRCGGPGFCAECSREAGAEVERLRAEVEALRSMKRCVVTGCGMYDGGDTKHLRARVAELEAEIAALRVAGQMVVQAHDDGDDMQSAIDQLSRLLDAKLEEQSGE